jgi:hypothetical protein
MDADALELEGLTIRYSHRQRDNAKLFILDTPFLQKTKVLNVSEACRFETGLRKFIISKHFLPFNCREEDSRCIRVAREGQYFGCLLLRTKSKPAKIGYHLMVTDPKTGVLQQTYAGYDFLNDEDVKKAIQFIVSKISPEEAAAAAASTSTDCHLHDGANHSL